MFWGWSEDKSPNLTHLNVQVWNESWIRTRPPRKEKIKAKVSIHSTTGGTVTSMSASTPRCSLGLLIYSPLSTWNPLRLPCFCHFLVMLLRDNPVLHSAKNSFFRTHPPRFESHSQNLLLVGLLCASESSFYHKTDDSTSQVIVTTQNT